MNPQQRWRAELMVRAWDAKRMLAALTLGETNREVATLAGPLLAGVGGGAVIVAVLFGRS